MKRFLGDNLVISLSIVLLMAVLVLVFAPMRYEINDDIVFKNILSGEDRYPPDFSSTNHVMSQILSYALYYLYAGYPAVPWFQLIVFLGSCLGIAITLSVFVKRMRQTKSSLCPLLLLPAMAVFFLFCLTQITFTSAALLLEFGVLVALIEWVTGKSSPTEVTPARKYLFALCLVMSFLLRWQLCLSALMFGVPILLFAQKYHIRKLLPLALLLSIVFAGDRMLFLLNETPHHHEFVTFNKARSSFNNDIEGLYYKNITNKAAKDAGWSMSDYWFFRIWIIYDNKLFNTEKIGIFLKENAPLHNAGFAEMALKEIVASAMRNRHYVLLFIFTVSSLICYRLHLFMSLGRKEKIRVLLSLGLVGFGILYLMYYRFPARIFVPLFVFISGTVFLLFDTEGGHRPRNTVLSIVTLIFFAISVSESYAQQKINMQLLKYSQEENSYVTRCLDQVGSSYGDPIFLQLFPTVSNGVGIENIHPFRPSTDFTVSHHIFSDQVDSPRYYAVLNQYGLKDGNAFLQWTINNERVLLVFFDRGGNTREIVKVLWESYYSNHISPTRHVSLEKIADFRNPQGIGLVFYRMVAR